MANDKIPVERVGKTTEPVTQQDNPAGDPLAPGLANITHAPLEDSQAPNLPPGHAAHQNSDSNDPTVSVGKDTSAVQAADETEKGTPPPNPQAQVKTPSPGQASAAAPLVGLG